MSSAATHRDFLKCLSLTGAALSVPGVTAAAPRLQGDRRSVTVTGRVTGGPSLTV